MTRIINSYSWLPCLQGHLGANSRGDFTGYNGAQLIASRIGSCGCDKRWRGCWTCTCKPGTQDFSVSEKGCEQGFVEVTGTKVNKGGGYGLEVPCIWPICTMKEIVDQLSSHCRIHLAFTVTTVQHNNCKSILYEVLSGWSFIIGGFLQGESLVGGTLFRSLTVYSSLK